MCLASSPRELPPIVKNTQYFLATVTWWKSLKRENHKLIIQNQKNAIFGFMNFNFMGGSMGRAVGDGIVLGAKKAIENKCPYIIFTSSGGARMQEGIISLMQMPRTVAAVELLNQNKIPYIVVRC